jgi:hypothetical protein
MHQEPISSFTNPLYLVRLGLNGPGQYSRMNNDFTSLSLIAALLLAVAGPVCYSDLHAQGDASRLFRERQQAVFQIRVIDTASNDKSAIGSGFQVSRDGRIATNFHVVSAFVHEPEQYRLEFVRHDGDTGPASLVGFDVIHDLAIVKADTGTTDHFRLRSGLPDKGDRIYSMGNPRDLGMTIVEGTYNGLVDNSRYRKILFSGSLNPGMSGGPAMDAEGAVIGTNVSKGGEQLSFLVPSKHLQALVRKTADGNPRGDGKEAIRDALHDDQKAFYEEIIDAPFSMEGFSELELPATMHQSLECWGHTVDEEDMKHESFHRHCKSNDWIYIRDDFLTGNFAYDYEWLTTDELNRFQFYTVVQGRFTPHLPGNASSKEYVSNYNCHTDFVGIANLSWKVAGCFREYKQYPGLYDALLFLTSVEFNTKAAVIKVSASGISRHTATALFKKIMGAVEWTH